MATTRIGFRGIRTATALGLLLNAAAWSGGVRPTVAAEAKLVPPATPLVACDPYFSIWSPGGKLADADTTHWTGKPHRLTSYAVIDGKPHRLLGASPSSAPPLSQKAQQVTPTRSIYALEGAGVEITLAFMTPAIPEDIDLLARPITYLTYRVRAMDGRPHSVRLYFDAGGELTVNTPDQHVVASSEQAGDLAVLKMGSKDQAILGRAGDDLRIDWGYLYVAAPRASIAGAAVGAPDELREQFNAAGADGLRSKADGASRPADQVAAALAYDLGSVGAEPVSRWLVLAYDDLYSIEYMYSPLRPYWRRNGLDALGLLAEAARDYPALVERCAAFDQELLADLEKCGGPQYAALCAVAYRQCFAAGKFVADAHGQPLQFCKENHSNGCIGTSDVFYPMSPQFFLFGPSLAKSFLVPFMNYAESDRWKFPFAPHDLGTYPKANGQVYGGGERTEENQMPVEESGNLLLLMAAVAHMEGNASFAERYWPRLEQWADYLLEKGFDPENQLCTDDFAGHLGHNVNLSAKAICGLGAFAQLCQMRGDAAAAAKYRAAAEQFAARWVKEADDGDHFRLAFDRPGTWSQKYNLVWDRVLGLKLFPEDVYRKEMNFYLRNQNPFGLPLDNRSAYTKLDWILWTATLTEKQEDFTALVAPVIKFLNETPDKSPMTDWYFTDSGRKRGFTARPVVGGVFMKALYDKRLWNKWASRDKTKSRDFAPLPAPPKVTAIVPAADVEPAEWAYVTEPPADGWQTADFDDSSWKKGQAGFGVADTPGAIVGTKWDGRDVWLRRTFDLGDAARDHLRLHVHHDDAAEVYINGKLAARLGGYTTGYQRTPIAREALDALRPTGNVMAIHCHQDRGGQYIDAGLVTVEPASE
ncbi:MAG: glutaminase [Planctomycetota bacterium]|nr:MAG: glutaminase [Planctomycetota bacterium]